MFTEITGSHSPLGEKLAASGKVEVSGVQTGGVCSPPPQTYTHTEPRGCLVCWGQKYKMVPGPEMGLQSASGGSRRCQGLPLVSLWASQATSLFPRCACWAQESLPQPGREPRLPAAVHQGSAEQTLPSSQLHQRLGEGRGGRSSPEFPVLAPQI